MPRIIMMTPDNATKALKLHHEAFAGGPCNACKGSCCVHCAPAEGYLRGYKSDVTDVMLKKMKEKYNYNKTTGFQGPTGCNLPAHERSPVCVGFSCGGYFSSANNGLTRGDRWNKVTGEALAGPRWEFSEKQKEANERLRDLTWDR